MILVPRSIKNKINDDKFSLFKKKRKDGLDYDDYSGTQDHSNGGIIQEDNHLVSDYQEPSLLLNVGSGTNVVDPDSRYTSFTSECISLTNSEMTSNFENFGDDYNDLDSVMASTGSNSEFVNPEGHEESFQEYQVGGYHPVKVGDVYYSANTNLNYQVLFKLGWGHFSTVWLCKCLELDSYFAVKVIKSNKVYQESAIDEIKILNHLMNPGNDYLMKIVDQFLIKGPNGQHVSIVFELLGESLLNLMHNYQISKKKKSLLLLKTNDYGGLPINFVKILTSQILTSIAYIHEKGIIHTDLKPENILIKSTLPKKFKPKPYKNFIQPCKPLNLINFSNLSNNQLFSKVTTKLSDFGNATFINNHFTNQIQTRQYRSPEIILGYKSWGCSTDMWSLGCLIFELVTGDYLFDPHDGGPSFSKDEDHLAQIIELLGEFPSIDYLHECENSSNFFTIDEQTKTTEFKNIKHLKFWGLKQVFIDKYKFKDDLNVKLLTDLILKCLSFNLKDRFDARSLLDHPWLNIDSKFSCDNLPNSNDKISGFTEELNE